MALWQSIENSKNNIINDYSKLFQPRTFRNGSKEKMYKTQQAKKFVTLKNFFLLVLASVPWW